jgi:integrase
MARTPVATSRNSPRRSASGSSSPVELARLGEALRVAERDGFVTLPARAGVREEEERAPVNRWAVAAIRLLVLTGARKSEILSLRWALDRRRIRAREPA